MKPIAIIIAVLAALAAAAASPRNVKTTRPRLKVQAPAAQEPALQADTLWSPPFITISGYEKTLRSRSESFLATNNGERDITGLRVTIDYLDGAGRQVHQASVSLKCQIPPGQTRMLNFPSWDKQCAWYYVKSAPARLYTAAAPYSVAVIVNYAICPLE